MTSTKNSESFGDVEDLVDLRSVWVGLRRRAALFVGAGAAVFAAVAAFAFLSTELYTAETSLMIEPKTQVFAYGAEVLGQTAADPTMVDTEVELLRSRAMAIRVNNRMRSSDLDLAEADRKEKAKVKDDFFSRRLSSIAADLAALQSKRNTMEAAAELTEPGEGSNASDENSIANIAAAEAAVAQNALIPMEASDEKYGEASGPIGLAMAGESSDATSDEAITSAAALSIVRRAENSGAINKLMKNLEIQRVGTTFLIKVRHSDPSPETAAAIANAYAEEYILQQLEAQYDELRQANSWIDARLATLRQEVRAADAAAAQYRAEQGLVDVSGESFSAKALSGIATELSAARTNFASAQARYSTVKRLVDSGAPFDSISEVMTSTVVSGLRTSYADLMRKRAELSVRYGDMHPEVKKLNEEMAALNAQIQSEQNRVVEGLRSEVSFAGAQVRSLEQNLKGAQGEMATNNKALVKLQELERDIEATRGVYEALLNRQKELNERDQLANANARIIARAEPPQTPSKPRKSLILAGGLLLALMIGGASAFAAESMDTRVRNTHDVRREFGPNAPVVLVPRIQSRLLFRQRRSDDVVRRYIQEEPESTFAESLRDLRMYLKSAQRELNHAPAIAFSSVFKGEGTTTISFSFASLLASGGARVAYIEYPTNATHFFKTTERREELDVDDGPRRLSDESGGVGGSLYLPESVLDRGGRDLAVSSSGDADSDASRSEMSPSPMISVSVGDRSFVPTQRLCGVQMLEVENKSGISEEFDISIFDSMIEKLRKDYDYVIIDAPSILGRNEGSAIASAADFTFMIMEWCSTTRGAARAATQRLLDMRARVLSFVVNKVDEKQRYYFRPEDRQFFFRKNG